MIDKQCDGWHSTLFLMARSQSNCRAEAFSLKKDS